MSEFGLMVLVLFLGVSLESTADTRSSAAATRTFNHPGLMHTEADFDRIREKINNGEGEEPWASAWEGLLRSGHASLTRHPSPVKRIFRSNDKRNNVHKAINDIKFSYAMALRWKISGDERYADRAVEFLNRWSETNKLEIWGGSERFLASGLQGYQFANVGEIMRTYDGWKQEDRKRFGKMLVDIFYNMNSHFLREHNGTCVTSYWANWGLANIASMMAIGVFTDRSDI